jgi:hypothetical protein
LQIRFDIIQILKVKHNMGKGDDHLRTLFGSGSAVAGVKDQRIKPSAGPSSTVSAGIL